MDWELVLMKQLSDELEIPLEQVMLVNATFEWLGIEVDDLAVALEGIYECSVIG